MADILIKNIDFPKGKEALALEVNRHGEVFVFYRDEASGRVAPLKRRESNAIELPSHGRLIDADKLFLEAERFDLPNIMPDSLWIEVGDLLRADTIVEASNGSDN